MTMLCTKCGGPMPELSPELKALARSAGGVALAHEVCPNETDVSPDGREFEVRVSIVELVEVSRDPDSGKVGEVEVTELIAFKAGLRAPNLDLAMRPLAEALGEKWQRAEKNANVADNPDGLALEVKKA